MVLKRILLFLLFLNLFVICFGRIMMQTTKGVKIDGSSSQINDKIKLVSPVEGMSMSSFVTSFKANSELDGPFYLEVSKDKKFRREVKRLTSNSIGKNTRNIYFFRNGNFELSKGRWYWRVASKLKNDWSRVRSVNIDTSMPTIKPLREISPDKPFFHARLRSDICTKPGAKERLEKLIPDDLKDVFILDHPTTWPSLLNGNSVIDYYMKVDKLGYPFTMDLGRPDGASHENQGDRAVTLGEAEYVFQHCKNCLGITTGELFYGYFYKDPLTRLFLDGAIDLAAKYGKYFFLSDMNWKWNKWNMFSNINYSRFKQRGLGRYFVPLYKTTDPWGALICMSAIQGMGICGMVDHYGIWSDMWLWEKFGYPDNYQNGNFKEFPYIFNMRAFLLSISQGGTVTALEPALAWDNKTAEPNENYYKYLIPFLRGVYKHHIMINRKAVMNLTKAIVRLNFDPSKMVIDYINDYYGNFYRSTYGLWDGGEEPAKEEIIPNTSRYGIIPFLPCDSADVPNGIFKLNITDIQSKENAERLIGKYYPKNNSQAYAIDLDNTIIVLNNLENRDEREYYSLELGKNGVKRMYGQITLMSYIMGKREPNQYWFQINGYTNGKNVGGLYNLQEYPSEIKFLCSRKPTVNIEQQNAVISQEWNDENKEFILKVQHKNGAVNFTISVPE